MEEIVHVQFLFIFYFFLGVEVLITSIIDKNNKKKNYIVKKVGW